MKVIKTDILVIGGGLAGLTAAIEAKNCKNTVTIVCKSITGKSGNTVVSGSAMAVVRPDNENDSQELLYKDVMRSSQGINDKGIAEYFAAHSNEVLDKLSGYGVVFRRIGDKYVTKRPPGHSVSRSFQVDISKVPYHIRGLSISLPLLKMAKEKNIQIIDNTMVYKLLKKEGRISGALAVSKRDNEIIQLFAKVIIIAAGGGANIYSMTDNTSDITGDSYILALEAGAELRDMEFVQYYPTMMFKPIKICISNPLFGEGAVLSNVQNDRFMDRYSKMGNKATRDLMALAVYSEIKAGRGNPDYVYVDCSQIPPKVINNKFAEFKNLLSKRGINIFKDRIPVSTAAHYYLGGIKVDGNCETGIPGLLACGEAVWGVHGANRLSGNALAEAVVFGSLAGKRAAKLAEITNSFLDIDCNQSIGHEVVQNGSYDIEEIKKRLRRLMWENVAVVRNESGLLYAREQVKVLSEKIEKCCIINVSDTARYQETKNLIRLCMMVIEGALARQESRGAHYREDYPSKNRKFDGNFVYRKNNGGFDMEFDHNNQIYSLLFDTRLTPFWTISLKS